MKILFLKLVIVGVIFVVTAPVAVSAEGPISAPVADARIVVFKEQRLLQLFTGEDLVVEYRVGLGFEPVADKQCEGDGATPEGLFRVCIKNPQSQFYLYPPETACDLTASRVFSSA